jgi:hypothetical protein
MIQSFTAEVYTEFDRYTIDLKPSGQYCLTRRGNGTYHETLQDAYNQIEYYYDQDMDRAIEQANLLNELEHNQ